jgi:hypothetical protein
MSTATKDTMGLETTEEAIGLAAFVADEALEQTQECDTWVKEYWMLRNALNDIKRLLAAAEILATKGGDE